MKLKLIFLLIFLPPLQLIFCQENMELNNQNEFIFIENNISLVPVIVYENAPPRTVAVAKEFIEYIYKITGLKPKLIIGNSIPNPNKAIWIGYQPILKTLFPEINFDLKQEEILLAANKNHLIILGRDVWDESKPKVKQKKGFSFNYQQEYGTINAVYTFLQDFLQVRWFFPGELGEDIIKTNAIKIKPFIYRYEPQIKARSGLFKDACLDKNFKNKKEITDWTMHNKTFYSSDSFNAGHPFVDWWDKYKDTYPKIFALTTKLIREPINDAKNVKLCISNSDIDILWLQEVEKILIDNPYTKNFSSNENDGYTYGFCTCEKCVALDQGNDYKKNKSLSDRHLHFANRLALKLQEKYPNKDYKVLFQAYGADRQLPMKEKPNEHVIVSSVANFHLNRLENEMTKNPKVIEYLNWNKLAKTQFWRPNLGSPVGKDWGMPDISLNQAFEDFKFIADHNCSGIFFDSFNDHWATQSPQYYIVAQLAWNPYLDKNDFFEDFYRRLYGVAATEMKIYWNLIENTRSQHYEKYPQLGRLYLHETYTDNWFIQAFSQLSNVEKILTESNSEVKYKKRITMIRQGLEYSQRIVNLRRLMSVLEVDLQNIKIKSEIETNWVAIYTLKEKMNYTFINFVYVNYPNQKKGKGSFSKRMMGLIPDYPLNKKIKKTIREFEITDN